jgi:hypothetical protein
MFRLEAVKELPQHLCRLPLLIQLQPGDRDPVKDCGWSMIPQLSMPTAFTSSIVSRTLAFLMQQRQLR